MSRVERGKISANSLVADSAVRLLLQSFDESQTKRKFSASSSSSSCKHCQLLLMAAPQPEGYLLLLRPNQWDRRYFRVLPDGYLYYYLNVEAYEPVGGVSIADIKSVRFSPSFKESVKHHCIFDVACPDRTYTLQASLEDEALKWVQALMECIQVWTSGSNQPYSVLPYEDLQQVLSHQADHIDAEGIPLDVEESTPEPVAEIRPRTLTVTLPDRREIPVVIMKSPVTAKDVWEKLPNAQGFVLWQIDANYIATRLQPEAEVPVEINRLNLVRENARLLVLSYGSLTALNRHVITAQPAISVRDICERHDIKHVVPNVSHVFGIDTAGVEHLLEPSFTPLQHDSSPYVTLYLTDKPTIGGKKKKLSGQDDASGRKLSEAERRAARNPRAASFMTNGDGSEETYYDHESAIHQLSQAPQTTKESETDRVTKSLLEKTSVAAELDAPRVSAVELLLPSPAQPVDSISSRSSTQLTPEGAQIIEFPTVLKLALTKAEREVGDGSEPMLISLSGTILQYVDSKWVLHPTSSFHPPYEAVLGQKTLLFDLPGGIEVIFIHGEQRWIVNPGAEVETTPAFEQSASITTPQAITNLANSIQTSKAKVSNFFKSTLSQKLPNFSKQLQKTFSVERHNSSSDSVPTNGLTKAEPTQTSLIDLDDSSPVIESATRLIAAEPNLLELDTNESPLTPPVPHHDFNKSATADVDHSSKPATHTTQVDAPVVAGAFLQAARANKSQLVDVEISMDVDAPGVGVPRFNSESSIDVDDERQDQLSKEEFAKLEAQFFQSARIATSISPVAGSPVPVRIRSESHPQPATNTEEALSGWQSVRPHHLTTLPDHSSEDGPTHGELSSGTTSLSFSSNGDVSRARSESNPLPAMTLQHKERKLREAQLEEVRARQQQQLLADQAPRRNELTSFTKLHSAESELTITGPATSVNSLSNGDVMPAPAATSSGSGSTVINEQHLSIIGAVRDSTTDILEHIHSVNTAKSPEYIADDRQDARLGDLIRGRLCSGLAKALLHGMKPPRLGGLLGPSTIWSVVEASVNVSILSIASNVSFPQPEITTVRKIVVSLNSFEGMENDPFMKYRTFVCACLNNKLLLSWLSHFRRYPEGLFKVYVDTAFMTCSTFVEWTEFLNYIRNVADQRYRLDPKFEVRRRARAPLEKQPVQDYGSQEQPQQQQQQQQQQSVGNVNAAAPPRKSLFSHVQSLAPKLQQQQEQTTAAVKGWFKKLAPTLHFSSVRENSLYEYTPKHGPGGLKRPSTERRNSDLKRVQFNEQVFMSTLPDAENHHQPLPADVEIGNLKEGSSDSLHSHSKPSAPFTYADAYPPVSQADNHHQAFLSYEDNQQFGDNPYAVSSTESDDGYFEADPQDDFYLEGSNPKNPLLDLAGATLDESYDNAVGQYQVLYDYTPEDSDGQLIVRKGDVLEFIQKVDSEWLLCSLRGVTGLVPSSLVTIV